MGIRHNVYEIVGIVPDVRYAALFEEPGPYVYYPVAQRFFQNMNLHVHVAGDPAAFVPAVRAAIAEVDDDLPIFNARPLSEERAISLSRQRTAVTLLGLSGILALALTILGTYSVTAYAVSQRTSEMGVRMALGADRGAILRLVLGQGSALIGAGLALGLVASVALGGRIQSLLLGVGRDDMTAYLGSLGLLALAALAACYFPARRAATIDPSTALRHDF